MKFKVHEHRTGTAVAAIIIWCVGSNIAAGQVANVPARPETGMQLAQISPNNFIKSYIDSNGGCFAWQSLLRSADWTRGSPFGKTNTEWIEDDFRALEQVLSRCITETNRHPDPAFVESSRQDLRANLAQRRQHLSQIVEQDQRRRAAQAAAEARQQESLRAVEQNRLQQNARREQQERQLQTEQTRREQAQANAFLREQTERQEREERQAARIAEFAQKITNARARQLRQVQAAGIPQQFLSAAIVLNSNVTPGTLSGTEATRRLTQELLGAASGAADTADIYNRISLENAISLLLDSQRFQEVAPFEGQFPGDQQKVYGFSVKNPNQRSQAFVFLLDGQELYLAGFGVSNNVRQLDESGRFDAERLLIRILEESTGK
jgi:hypothetical protein